MIVWTRETFSERGIHASVAEQGKRALSYLEWLTTRHPHRPKGGRICPHMPGALKHQCAYLVSASLNLEKGTSCEKLVRQCVAYLKERVHINSVPATIVIFFPEIFPMSDLVRVRRSLNEEVRSEGYLIASLPNSSLGLYDDEWRPFESGVKMLAVRGIVPRDAATIPHTGGLWIPGRLRFIQHYLREMGKLDLSAPDQEWVEHALALRRTYRRRAVAYGITAVLCGIVPWFIG